MLIKQVPYDEFKEQYNSLTTMTQNMAEYLAMVEVFCANSRLFDNFVIVPKKATKAAYQGAFFNTVLGPNTEYVITLRHPVAAAISTYEKSTGLPQDGLVMGLDGDAGIAGQQPDREDFLQPDEILLAFPGQKDLFLVRGGNVKGEQSGLPSS